MQTEGWTGGRNPAPPGQMVCGGEGKGWDFGVGDEGAPAKGQLQRSGGDNQGRRAFWKARSGMPTASGWLSSGTRQGGRQPAGPAVARCGLQRVL